jgi:putative ABC transport system ATP-binding protein
MDLIRAVVHAESATAIIATHDQAVQGSADRILRIQDGALLSGGRHAAPPAA